jgi:hypothetical protein
MAEVLRLPPHTSTPASSPLSSETGSHVSQAAAGLLSSSYPCHSLWPLELQWCLVCILFGSLSNRNIFMDHSATGLVWHGRNSSKPRFRARGSWNAVNYLAPLVTWRCGFWWCEGLVTLWQHWGRLSHLHSPAWDPGWAIFLTLANQIRQRSDLCLRSLFFCLSALKAWLVGVAKSYLAFVSLP